MESILLTTTGHARLQTELKELHEQRPGLAAEIDEARSHGDLKENAEYHAAKEKQGMMEARIRQLEGVLSRAQVIDPISVNSDRIQFGATVVVADVESDDETTYALVGEDEADIERGFISITSPIGRALMGKEEGDEAVVNAPRGKRTYEIVSVNYKALV